MKSLSEVIAAADLIYSAHEEGAVFDAAFDGGEFSGPSHDRMAEREVEQLAVANGLTLDQVLDEYSRLSNEGEI